MREELVNELTGEVLTLREHIDNGRRIEREIFKIDNTIDDLKSSLKAAKEDRLKFISRLRETAREIRLKSPKPTAIRNRAAKTDVKS